MKQNFAEPDALVSTKGFRARYTENGGREGLGYPHPPLGRPRRCRKSCSETFILLSNWPGFEMIKSVPRANGGLEF